VKHSLSAPAAVNPIPVVALCCLVAAFEGIDLQAPGLTAPVLGVLFRLTPAEKGLFLSSSTFGLIIGAAIGGRLSDLIGRKWVLIVAVMIFGLMTVMTAFSTSTQVLMVTRFATGLGLGGALPNIVALVSEHVRLERRSSAVGVLYASLPTGGALASMVAALASRQGQWPVVYLVGGIAPLVTVPLLALILPNHKSLPRAKKIDDSAGVVIALFGEHRAVRTVALWIAFFFALLTLYLLLGWLPSLMVGRGLTRIQASSVQMAFNAFGALGSIVTGLILDKYRRVPSVIVIFILALAAIAFLAAMPAEFAVAILAGGLVGATVSATQTTLYALAPDCYPTPIRGTGLGFAVAVGRVGSAVGPLLAGFLIGRGRSPVEVLAGVMPILTVAALGAVVVAMTGHYLGSKDAI
jgi:AAHS family 3-hydroxyphenylpropionic acid transporter